MSIQINDIIDLLYYKYKDVSKADIARITKSQFKLLKNTIKIKGDKKVNIIYIGKFKPTPYRAKQLKDLKENEVVKEA